MRNIKEKIEIMSAYANGADIEVRYMVDDEWLEYHGTEKPTWNWAEFDYRIKAKQPEKKFVPYDNADEFLQAQKEHGPYINMFGIYHMPSIVKEHSIYFYGYRCSTEYSFSELCSSNLWQDGTRIGKEITE